MNYASIVRSKHIQRSMRTVTNFDIKILQSFANNYN